MTPRLMPTLYLKIQITYVVNIVKGISMRELPRGTSTFAGHNMKNCPKEGEARWLPKRLPR